MTQVMGFLLLLALTATAALLLWGALTLIYGKPPMNRGSYPPETPRDRIGEGE